MVLPSRIDSVRGRLDVNAVGPKDEKSEMQENREKRNEPVDEPHGGFDQIEEHAHHTDNEVVLCVAGKKMSIFANI